MNESHKELLRRVQELFQASERRMAASYDKIENAIDNCRLAMGGTVTSSSTSAWSDVCCDSEVPAPASSSPDTNLIVATDVEDPAAPTPARCSMEGPSRHSTELRSASAPATAPATPTDTVDIVPVLAAAAASDGTLDGEAICGVADMPATCSMVCLPRHLLAARVLVASLPPTPTEYVLDTNSVHVAVLPLAVPDVFPAVPAPAAPTVQLQQLYNDNGDDTRPLPWPSFKEIDDCESPSDAVMKPSQQYRFGNLFTSTGCIIINDMCISSELRCLDEVLLFFKYWSSTSDCVQSVQATFVCPPCSITRFKWVIIRSVELKLFSHGLEQSLILDSIGRSDSSYDHFSCVFRDASHWHEYFVTGFHMHVKAICSVWRLLIGSVTSVPFLNLEKFLVRPKKKHGELLYVSGLYLTKFSGMFRESLQGCDIFQWAAWYISYHLSLSSLHTRSTCAILLMSAMAGQLINAVVLLMLIPCNSYAALVEVCFPCSVPDHSYKWLMPWSITESKALVSCCLTSHGHSEVVKWYIEPAPLLVCRGYIDLNLSSMSFGMLRASPPVLENRQPRAIFLTACTVMLQSTELYSKEQSSWIYEIPKEDQRLVIYLAKLSGMVREFQNWLIYMLQHPNSRRPESAMTRAISHVSAFEPIPITFHVFPMSLELALNYAAIGQRVLLILSHYNALRYWVLWSFTTAVPTEMVNMFNTHPSAAVMIELLSAVAADHSWDVPLLFSMYPSISFSTVQILFSAQAKDRVCCSMRVLNQLSWCTLNPWSPLLLMIYTYWLLLEHVSVGVDVLDLQFLMWINIVIFSGCNTPLPESVNTRLKQLALDGILLFLQDGRVDITKCNIRTCFSSIWHCWFSTCYDEDPFQGGRRAIAVTTFEQVFACHKYYLDPDNICASVSCHLSASFQCVPVGHDFYFYLCAVYPNSGYYCDSNNINDRLLQWDPGRFMVMSAWGQAEFQGGRGVRDPYLYMGCYWVLITGLAQL